MDPYVVFTYEGVERKSTIIDEGGKKAKWDNETFNFSIGDRDTDKIHIQVLDEDLTCSDNVGESDLSVKELAHCGGTNSWFNIKYKGEVSGKVHLETKFTKYEFSAQEETKDSYEGKGYTECDMP